MCVRRDRLSAREVRVFDENRQSARWSKARSIRTFSSHVWPSGKAMIYVLATLIWIVAGLRTMLPPTVVNWAVRTGAVHLQGTSLAFSGKTLVAWILSAFATSELVLDRLPTMPSRTTPGLNQG